MTTTETIEDERIVAKCYMELGNVTKEKGEYDESLRYHRKSMEIFERIDDALSVADSHLNIAEIYKAKGELKQAMSEYEKGLTLYEDVYVEDGNKTSDHSNDASLTSSSFSDLQHTKVISKSDETLPQTTLIDVIEKVSPVPSPSLHPVNGEMHRSTNSLDQLVSSTKKINDYEDILQLTASVDDCSLINSEKMIDGLRKSFSSASLSDLLFVNTSDILLPLLPTDLTRDMTNETVPDKSDILENSVTSQPPVKSVNQDLLVSTTRLSSPNRKVEDINGGNKSTNIQKTTASNKKNQESTVQQLWYRLPNTRFLIIILSLFLTGVLFWSLYAILIRSSLTCSSSDFTVYGNSPSQNYDDLSGQLRKLLTWRKDRLTSLNQENRRIIDDFLSNSSSRTKMTIDKFQRILNMLDLKIVLIPQ